jgi:hypothetical protein
VFEDEYWGGWRVFGVSVRGGGDCLGCVFGLVASV